MSPTFPDDLPSDSPASNEPELRWDDLPGWPRTPESYQSASEPSAADQLESLILEQQQARVLRNAALGP